MKTRIYIINFILLVFCKAVALCQPAGTVTDSIKTKSEARFSEIKDGVYFTLAELQKNKPSITKEQLFKSYYDKTDFTLSQWANTQSLYFTTGDSIRRKVNRDSLWGYVENGTPFIFLNGKFHKFSTIGSISIFTESYPSMTVGMAPVVTDAKTGVFIRMFDFTTGEMNDYSYENASHAIAKDEELFEEFKALKTLKAKKKKVYKFIERYNEKHGLFRNI
jgi:hypothetical protein